MEQNEKKSWIEKAKETLKKKWKKAKQFSADHAGEIAVGAFAIVTGTIGIIMSNNDSNDNDSYRNLHGKSYDELNDIREDVRLDYKNPRSEHLLNVIDRAREAVGNPREKHARSLSDEELQTELEAARNLYNEEYEINRKDKRPYDEKRLDEAYKKYSINYDNFYQLQREKERRYAEAHPDEFPRHREHGWYLDNDE